jgi:DNA-binding PadR family transcriptional regulator
MDGRSQPFDPRLAGAALRQALYPPVVPPGPGGFGHGPPGAAPKVRRGDVRAAALALLSERPSNGYQIIQQIAERSHGIWRPSPGSVYPALQQLEDEGLIQAEESGGRRTYRLTEDGRAYVVRNDAEIGEPWAAVAESVSDDLVELQAMFGQVGMAMRQVAEVGTAAQRVSARKVLADARKALYWLLAEDEEQAPRSEGSEHEHG